MRLKLWSRGINMTQIALGSWLYSRILTFGHIVTKHSWRPGGEHWKNGVVMIQMTYLARKTSAWLRQTKHVARLAAIKVNRRPTGGDPSSPRCRQYRTVRIVIKPRKGKRRGWIKWRRGYCYFFQLARQPQEYAGKILTYSGFQEKSYVGVAPFKLNTPTGRLVLDICLIMHLTFVRSFSVKSEW